MAGYDVFARYYDALTANVDYKGRAAYLKKLLEYLHHEPGIVLDLACGTGSMSLLLAQRGYRVLASDISEEMLTVAAQKTIHLANPPFYICQSMQRLRLPEPVDAVFCLLDSLNYLDEPTDCKKTFERVYKSLKSGGMFLFDINTPEKLKGLDGQVFLDENEESYCVWRAEFDEAENRCYYGIDLFRKRAALWERSFEQHCEYAYSPEQLCAWLKECGFSEIRQYGDCVMQAPRSGEQRIYFSAVKE